MSTPPPIASPPASSPPVPATNSTSPPPSIPSAQPPPSSSPSSSTPLSSPPPATRISPPPSSTPLAPAATSSHSPPPTLNSTSPSTSGSSAASPPPSRSNNHPSTIPSAPGRSSPPPPIVSGSLPSGSNNLTTGVVVGIAVGAVSILLIVSILCICCAKKKRRRRDEETYYMSPPPGPKPKAHTYGGPPRCLQHNAPPPSDNVVTMMPKPSPPQPIASRSQQSPMYVPPKPYTNSSAGSGSNYSGFSNIRPPPPLPHYSLGFSKSTFTYEELALATDAFSDANLLGQGGFGYVHKGVLPNGKEIAVKQLKAGSGQGEREFQAEVEIISRVHHRHLVSLVGYCMSRHQRMLVYEFVPNNNLEFHLHGKGQPTMDLPTRLKIALGSAKGLAYLHEDCHPKIIHRDIKASNILLDFRFEAKVADFGLAKITSDANTHVSTRVMGTFGYLAPEYASSGKLTDKSDVFSFGIMLLELITGRLPVDASHSMEDSLVDWARPLLNLALDDRNFYDLVDPRLRNDYDPNEMSCMVVCAAACVQHSARRRPRMSQIVRALEGDMCFSDLNEGIRPRHSNLYSSYGSSDYDTSQYNEDLKKCRKMALGSKEYGASSEYSEPTSKYGLYPSGSSSGEAQTTREMEMRKFGKNNQDFRGSS